MENEAEVKAIACVPKGWSHVPKSTLDKCSKCGREVWVSPSGKELVEKWQLEVICLPCMPEDAEIMPATPEQLDAIQE